MTDDAARRAGLVASLAAVRQRIVDAAEACGRDPRSITLVAVTKTYPAADVAALAELGVLDVGESREQEARAKVRELAHRSFSGDLRWHLVGRLQTNKARSVAGFAHAVHSVDRPKLATALAGAASERGAVLDVFVQVSLDDDPERGGAGEQDVAALTDLVASHPSLRLRGVMAVPPIEADPDLAFARLAAISARVRESHPDADAISAGMSHDLESAVRHGSTHVRVGSALLGRRTP